MKSSTQVSPIVVPPARRISSAGRSRLLMLAVLPTAALLLPQLAHAVTTDTWTGAAGVNWNTVNNWSTTNPAGVPLPGDSLLFSSGPASSNNNFIAGTAFGSITFDSSAPAYSLTGNALILGNSPFNGGVVATNAGYLFSTTNYDSLVNNSSNLQTISAPITLSALSATASTGGLHNIIGGAAGITLNGAFTRSFSSTATFSGLVNVGASGIANNAAGIIGGWATYGGDFATVNAGAVTAFTGYVNVNSGPITSNPTSVVKLTGTSSSLNGASGTITDLDSINFLGNVGVNGNTSSTLSMATGQILRLGATGSIFRSDTTSTVGTATPANMIVGNAAGTGVLTAGGPVTDAPGELILNVTNTTSNITNTQSIDDLTINANIANNGAGMVTLVKTGQGGLKLAGNNTFTGNIYINEGTIRDGAGGFSAGNGTIFVSNGAQAYVVTNPTTGIIPNNIVIAGKGRYEGQSTIPDFLGGAIRMATAGTNWTGCITLSDDARITARGSTGSPFSTISGKITGAYQLELGGAASGNLTLSNPANDWSGGTMISSGTLRLGANDVIPNGPGKGNLIMNGDGLGNTAAGTPLPTIFDLNGHSETVNGLADGLTNTAACITNSGAPGAVLTIGDNNASATYSGQIAGTAGIAKIGSGTQTLANSLAYSGPTTVSGGTLAISFLNNTSVITVNSPGTLDTSAAGSLSLQTGQTIIANGGTITTNVSVSSGAFMAGSNFANNSVSIDGGSVSPGATALAGVVGTTSIANLIINNGQENVDAFGAGDNLTVTNTLNVNGTFNILINANPVAGTYTVIQAGTLSGISNINLPVTSGAGFTYSLVETANTVKLVVAGALLNLTWNNTGGAGSPDGATWDTTQQNWHSGATPSLYSDGANVTFDDTTPAGHYTVNIAGSVSPGIMTVNTINNYTFNGGSIDGTTFFVKSGAGAVTINTSNSFNGGTTLNLGTINVGTNTALGTGSVIVNAGTIDNISGSSVALANPITLTGNLTTGTSTNPSTLEFDGPISGPGGITKNGSDALTLAGTNTFTGNVILNSGTLNINNNNALGGSPTAINTLTIASGTTIDNTSGASVDFKNTNVNIGGNITFTGTQQLVVGTEQDTGLTAVVPPITTLTSNVTLTTVNSTLVFFNYITGNFGFTKLGTGTLELFTNQAAGNTFTGGIDIVQGTVAGDLFGSLGTGPTTIEPAGTLRIGDGFTNPVIFSGGLIVQDDTASLNGNITVTTGTTSTVYPGDINGTTTHQSTWTGTLSGGGNLLIKAIGSAAVLSAPDSQVTNILHLNTNVASTFTGNITIPNNSKVDLINTASGSPLGTGTVILTAGDATLGNTVTTITTTGGYSEFNLRNNSTGNITLANNIAVTGSGLAVLNMVGTAPTGSTVTVNNLTLSGQTVDVYLATPVAIPINHPLIFNSVTLAGGISTVAPYLPGFGNATFGTTGTSASNLSLGSITETVAGSGLTMGGLNTLFLTASNTFSGPFAIASGKVVLSSATPTVTKVGGFSLPGTYGGSASAASTYTSGIDISLSKMAIQDSSGTRAADIAQLKNEALTSNTASSTVGIYSSDVDAFNLAAGKIVKVVVVSDNAVRIATFPAGSTNFGGINNVDANSILVTEAYKGDANLDGVVDIQDLTDVANHWQQSVTDWSQGDFDGSNFVDISDLTSIANNWQAGVGSSSSLSVMPSFIPSVATPEPTSLALLTLGGLLLTKKRRK